jgi:large subunit ribosomal protein L28
LRRISPAAVIKRTVVMSKICKLTGKRPITGNNVSHSNRKTKRRFLPNLQKKRFFVPETGEWVTLRISTSAIRNISKLGLTAYLKKLDRKGVDHGVKL